jgi:mRNA interferase YafQ
VPKVELSPAFKRAFKKFVGKNPHLYQEIVAAMRQLEINPREPWLETHKLRGEWTGYLACSAGYDLRIIFEFITNKPEDDILLIDIGTHDEVY